MAEGTATAVPTSNLIPMPGGHGAPQPSRPDVPLNLNRLEPTSKPLAPGRVVQANIASNYAIGAGHTVLIRGQMYRGDDVLPGWYCDLDGGLQGKINNGALVETKNPTNKKLVAPAPKTEVDPVPALANENIRLTAELENAVQGNKMLFAQLEELKSQDEGRIRAMAELSDKVEYWRKIAEDREQQLRDYDALLNAPADPAPTEPPPAVAATLEPVPEPKKKRG